MGDALGMNERMRIPIDYRLSFGRWHNCPDEVGAPAVFIFERPRYKKPSKEQLLEYSVKRSIVESLGGHMELSEFELAGEEEPFSERDEGEMILLVNQEHPGAKIVDTWNGVGCYTMSIATDYPGATVNG